MKWLEMKVSHIKSSNSLVVKQIKQNGGEADFFRADFSLMSEVRKFHSEYSSKNPRVDVALMSHGIIAKQKTITKEGLELGFATNYLR
jgi:hypothetical protein